MNKTDISWCDYTWNPVTGCKRGCAYCYARKIHNRFNETPFSDIVFHPERLDRPGKVTDPKTVFVGSMSDVEYWKPSDLCLILDVCRKYNQHTYMFLSKSALSFHDNVDHDYNWPENTMQGLTIECSNSINATANLHSMMYFKRRFLSIEPLLGPITHGIVKQFELVIVGAMTGQKAVKPQKSWIQSIIDNVPAEKIHWKPNILPYIKEYGIDLQNPKG